MSIHTLSSLLLALAAGHTAPAPHDDWPQWGGPQHTGVSSETKWNSKGKDAPLWKREVGLGYSSCAVVGNRLYTLGFDKESEHDVVFCLDVNTGEEVWTHDYPAQLMAKFHGGGTLTTPTVDGERVYTAEREGNLLCLKAKGGELVWSHQVSKELELAQPQWGFAASPFVLGAQVILNYGKVLAFDKESGKLLWKTEKNYGDAYSTPVDLQYGGQPALAVFTGKGLALLAVKDGHELGFTPWETQYQINAMTPLVFEQKVFISSGYERGCALIDLAAKDLKIVWESKVMRSQMSGPVPWQGNLYGFDDKVLKCIDLAGQEKWRERGLGQGALSVSDGRLIVMSEEGELVVAEAAPAAFHELSRTKVFDGGPCWTVPVLADGRIYVRSHAGELAALDHRAQ